MSRIPLLVLALSIGACGGGSSARPDPRKVSSEAAPGPITLAADRQDLVFRYLDASGAVATAGKLDDIPAGSRRQVVVYDPKAPSPPGWEQVADLSNGLPATAKPVQGFAFATADSVARPAGRPSSVATDAAHEVVMFTSPGCGYCAKARKFLKSRSIPFTEMDLEADPQAPARLGALGQRAGLTQRDLQGVPIIFVDGKPVLGWDEGRVGQLLGLRG